MPDRQRLARGTEENLLVRHQAPEANGMDRDPVHQVPARIDIPSTRAIRVLRARTGMGNCVGRMECCARRCINFLRVVQLDDFD